MSSIYSFLLPPKLIMSSIYSFFLPPKLIMSSIEGEEGLGTRLTRMQAHTEIPPPPCGQGVSENIKTYLLHSKEALFMHSDTEVTKKNNNECTIVLVHLILQPLSSLPLSLLLCLPHVVSTPHSNDAQSSPVGH